MKIAISWVIAFYPLSPKLRFPRSLEPLVNDSSRQKKAEQKPGGFNASGWSKLVILDTSEPPGVEKTVTGIIELPDRLSKGGMTGMTGWFLVRNFFGVEISGFFRDSKLQWFDSNIFQKVTYAEVVCMLFFLLTYTYSLFSGPSLCSLACLVGFQHPRRNPCI